MGAHFTTRAADATLRPEQTRACQVYLFIGRKLNARTAGRHRK
jgi:hypothetical protein